MEGGREGVWTNKCRMNRWIYTCIYVCGYQTMKRCVSGHSFFPACLDLIMSPSMLWLAHLPPVQPSMSTVPGMSPQCNRSPRKGGLPCPRNLDDNNNYFQVNIMCARDYCMLSFWEAPHSFLPTYSEPGSYPRGSLGVASSRNSSLITQPMSDLP